MSVSACPFWARATALATRRLPAGRYRAAQWLPHSAPFVATFPPAPGLRFVCDLRDAIAREVFFAGTYEPQLTLLMRALLGRGDVVADVGANWGYFTLLAAALVGERGRVFSFEPEPGLFHSLAGQVALNALHHVAVGRVAVAGEAGQAWFQPYRRDEENRGTSRLIRGVAEGALAVETAALDVLLDDRNVRQVGLVKIDVEGGELPVLEGMSAGLRAGRYRRVLLEWHPRHVGPDAIARASRDLESAGYVALSIDHSRQATRQAAYRGQVRLRPATMPTAESWPHWLLVRRGELADTLAILEPVTVRE